MVETVDVAGILRYELQKEVAGGPRTFRTLRQPVTLLQLTARSLRISGFAALSEAVAERKTIKLRSIFAVCFRIAGSDCYTKDAFMEKRASRP